MIYDNTKLYQIILLISTLYSNKIHLNQKLFTIKLFLNNHIVKTNIPTLFYSRKYKNKI
jgi:hypothetical protein